MLNRLFKRIKADFDASCQSIKIPEVEERFDIYFSRFFGYYFAKMGLKLGLTPNAVSVVSLIIGAVSGVAFLFQDDIRIVLAGCFLLTWAGVLDSADGQLARMTGTSSEFGRKLDALIDNLVFASCYSFAAIYFRFEYTHVGIILITLTAGYCHSVKSACYDFFKTECIYYLKETDAFFTPKKEEIKKPEHKSLLPRILDYLEVDYFKKQLFFVSRKWETREKFSNWAAGEDSDRFIELYKEYNNPMLFWWALFGGTNTHRSLLMICSLFGHFDYYFFITIITIIPLFIVNYAQRKQDEALIRRMEQPSLVTT